MNIVYGLILENDEEQYKRIAEAFSRIATELNFSFDFEYANGPKAAKDIINSCAGIKDISVVVSDLTMGTAEFRGLLWIQGVKEAFPDIPVIACTGADISHNRTSAKSPSFDYFIPKSDLYDADPIDPSIIEKVAELLFNRTRVKITEDSLINSPNFKNGRRDRNLNSLCQQAFYLGRNPDNFLKFDSVRLESIDGGFSSSDVFRAELLNEDATIGVPSILKVSPIMNARTEADNYRSFVKWLLPYEWRVELLGYGETKTLGAICYSFVRSGLARFSPLNENIESGQSEIVKSVIDSIFSSRYQTWYDPKFVIDASQADFPSLDQFYLSRLFSKEQRANAPDIFRERAQRYCGAIFKDDFNIEIETGASSISIRSPSSYLFTNGAADYQTCICHGDLHGGNILRDAEGGLSFIDFQATGRGHVFLDFVCFENSIRLSFPADPCDIEDEIKYEGLISDEDIVSGRKTPVVELPPKHALIRDLRESAVKNFPTESFSNYLFASAIFNLRLLRIDDFTAVQYRSILSSLIASMSRLPK